MEMSTSSGWHSLFIMIIIMHTFCLAHVPESHIADLYEMNVLRAQMRKLTRVYGDEKVAEGS